MTLLWVAFVLVGSRKEDRSATLRIWQSLRSLSLYALFEGFKYYTYINLAKVSFSDQGVIVLSKEAKSLFVKNIKQLLIIFIRAGAFLGTAILFILAIIGWNSLLGFLGPIDYFWFVVLVLFFLFLLQLFSEQITILFYYIKSYHPDCSFEKIGLNLDPDYIPDKKVPKNLGFAEVLSKS